MQFVYHIRKDIDIVGLICHLFGSQIGAVIIPSQVAHYQGDIYRDLALNYTGVDVWFISPGRFIPPGSLRMLAQAQRRGDELAVIG